jgi:hypothetical protein
MGFGKSEAHCIFRMTIRRVYRKYSSETILQSAPG